MTSTSRGASELPPEAGASRDERVGPSVVSMRRRYERWAPVAPLKWPGSATRLSGDGRLVCAERVLAPRRPGGHLPRASSCGFSWWICCISRGRGTPPRPTPPAPADQCRRPPDQDSEDDA